MKILFKQWCINTNNFELLEQLDLKLNPSIDLESLSIGSNKYVIWKCKNGHTWKTQVCNRIRNNQISKCPYCNNIKCLAGYNDLKTICPEAASLFDEKKNKISASEVLANSTQYFYFKCSKGHTFKAMPKRFIKNPICPLCEKEKNKNSKKEIKPAKIKKMKEIKPSKYILLKDYNKKLTKQFDLEKNQISLENVFINKNTKFKYWWTCENGHSFKCCIANRLKGVNCPYCSKKNRKALTGVTDLATEHPDLLKDWDYEKNDLLGLDPTRLTSGSAKRVHWKCHICGAEWTAQIRYRVRGTGICPNNKIHKNVDIYIYIR